MSLERVIKLTLNIPHEINIRLEDISKAYLTCGNS